MVAQHVRFRPAARAVPTLPARREMVFDRGLGRLRPVGRVPCLSSAGLNWRGYRLEQHALPFLDSRDVVWMNHVVVLSLNPPSTLEVKDGARFVRKRMLPGQITVLPAQALTSTRSRDPLELLLLSLEPQFLMLASGEHFSGSRFELKAEHCVEDRFIEGVCLALKREVEEAAPFGPLYTETLATSLAVHLARHYSIHKTPRETIARPIAPRVVRQAMDFIHTRLADDLRLGDIAQAVGVSPFHFARLFKQAVGLSPYQFVLRQRIDRAKELLLAGELTPAAIAVESGFYDESHLANHLKRLCGVTPREFVARFGLRQ